MVQLDYSLSPSWNAKSSATALPNADESVLRYDLFLGDIIFVIGEIDLSARWGWVPVLDFALGLSAVIDAVGRHADHKHVFEFTESEATIGFRREGDAVEIRASYAFGAARVTYEDLHTSVRGFVARVLDDVVRQHPELRRNGFIAGLLDASQAE